jgi:hypothetical protein
MGDNRAPVRALLVRSWVHETEPVRASIRAAGFELELTRVDHEAALDAALSQRGFDVAVYDPATPGVSLETLRARLREHDAKLALVVIERIASIGDDVLRALDRRRS